MLGTSYWAGHRLIDVMAERFGVPVRLLNDAAAQGLGVAAGDGLGCVITLGTGVGCAVFRRRKLLLHVEFELPAHVKIVSNAAGVTGGVRLWEREMDDFFIGEPNAQWPRTALEAQ